MANVFEPEFEPDEEYPPGYAGRHARIGRQARTKRLGASVYEIFPGQSLCPYHWHTANEELLVVLSGRPRLRTPQGERDLTAGEVVSFRVGEEGAHEVTNPGENAATVLMVSEMNAPEVAVYPDSSKLMARQQAPGTPAEGIRAIFRLDDQVDYWEGETGGEPT